VDGKVVLTLLVEQLISHPYTCVLVSWSLPGEPGFASFILDHGVIGTEFLQSQILLLMKNQRNCSAN